MKSKWSNNTIAQDAALGYCLSDNSPNNHTFDQIIEALESGKDDFMFWEPFENFDPAYMADVLENTRSTIQRAIDEALEAAKVQS